MIELSDLALRFYIQKWKKKTTFFSKNIFLKSYVLGFFLCYIFFKYDNGKAEHDITSIHYLQWGHTVSKWKIIIQSWKLAAILDVG